MTTTEEDKKPLEIEVDDPEPVEINALPYLVVREVGGTGPSIRLARCWVFEKVQTSETPLTPATVQYIEMVAQLLVNGIVPPRVVK